MASALQYKFGSGSEGHKGWSYILSDLCIKNFLQGTVLSIVHSGLSLALENSAPLECSLVFSIHCNFIHKWKKLSKHFQDAYFIISKCVVFFLLYFLVSVKTGTGRVWQ